MEVSAVEWRQIRGCSSGLLIAFIGAFAIFSEPAWGTDEDAPGDFSDDLTELSLEELMEVDVTSVSKRQESLFGAPAAIYVMTNEALRRNGVTTIGEALRIVPGVQVARIDSNKWAISSRGFNGRLANKLLVLIDGRTIYTPSFSGVLWDVQDELFEDIDRIEVIRGPGGTLWGANAVNGVINIITRPSWETQGVYAEVIAGTEERASTAVRYGGKITEDLYYRVFFKGWLRDSSRDPSGGDADDEWSTMRGGFRFDGRPSPEDHWTLQSQYYRGQSNSASVDPVPFPPFSVRSEEEERLSGTHLLFKWSRESEEGAKKSIQVYFDRTNRKSSLPTDQLHETYDFEYQQNQNFGRGLDLVWGLGYRSISDKIGSSLTVFPREERRRVDIVSGFFQDRVTLVEDRLSLTLGSKFEHNDFTGFEVQPSARLLWTPDENFTAWGAVSRAVRTPSRAEDDTEVRLSAVPDPQSGLPVVGTFVGNRDFESENLHAFELGSRFRPSKALALDVATFFNDYDDLRVARPGSPQPPTAAEPFIRFPLWADNESEAKTFGVEVSGTWTPGNGVLIDAGYSYLRVNITDEITDLVNIEEGSSPEHQAHVRGQFDLTDELSIDSTLYYVDRVESYDIPAYLRLDVRFGWRPSENFEASLSTLNLLDPHHPEFGSQLGEIPTEVQRSVFLAARVRF